MLVLLYVGVLQHGRWAALTGGMAVGTIQVGCGTRVVWCYRSSDRVLMIVTGGGGSRAQASFRSVREDHFQA